MRDRILRYLAGSAEAQTSDQILRAVLKIHSPNAVSADSLLRSIIGEDPRFHFEAGLWRPSTPSRGESIQIPNRPIALFIQGPEARAHPMCLRGGLFRSDTGETLQFDLSQSLQRLDVASLRLWRNEAERCGLLLWTGASLRLWNRLLQSCGLPRQQGCTLCLRKLACRTLSRPVRGLHPEDLAAELEIPAPDSDRPARAAAFMSACLEQLLDRVPEEYRAPLETLARWAEGGGLRVDFSRLAFGREFLRQLPEGAGVYVLRNRASDIVYVGKAGNLKRRVSSYFTPRALENPKVARIHDQLHSLEVIPTSSELEALLLEIRMIRDFRPPVNLQIEVHEQSAGYGKDRNLLLLAAHPEAGAVEIYFLRDGRFVGQQPARLGKPLPGSLRAKIRSIYFSSRRRKSGAREAWEMEIVSRWLKRNRSRINFVDTDDAGDFESAVRRLSCYLQDPDRLSRKVLYR